MEEEKEVVETTNNEEINTSNDSKKPCNKNNLIIIIAIVALIIVGGLVFYFVNGTGSESKTKGGNSSTKNSNVVKDDAKKVEDDKKKNEDKSVVAKNDITSLDLDILKENVGTSNFVFSPISLKYVLKMLEDATNENSKKQLSNLISDYKISKYVNSENINVTNALFVNDSYRDNIKNSYIEKLKADYNADVVSTSFDTPKEVNNYISEKTYNLINYMFDNISKEDFILLNTTAINTEWENKIAGPDYIISFSHVNYDGVSYNRCNYNECHFNKLNFDYRADVNALPIVTVAFEYNVVDEVGESNIRKTVKEGYEKYLADGGYSCANSTDEYVDRYIDNLKDNYKVDSSTDYGFYVDDNIKVFAKNLKDYNGVTLQYIGIMPIKENIANYVKNLSINDINDIIKKIVFVKNKDNTPTKDDGFKNGVVTEVTGNIPVFNIENSVNLVSVLNKMGVTDIFDSSKSNLTNLSTNKNAFISVLLQKSNIEFSNDGIKAAAATVVSGKGAAGCGFDYKYDVPVEKIDITFNKPYMYLVRNIETGEVWFMGTVYNPTAYTE